jgi:hypothetical protein
MIRQTIIHFADGRRVFVVRRRYSVYDDTADYEVRTLPIQGARGRKRVCLISCLLGAGRKAIADFIDTPAVRDKLWLTAGGAHEPT